MTKTERKRLETALENAYLHEWELWQGTRAKGDRDGVRFRGMVTQFGMLETLKRLLANPQNRARQIVYDKTTGWGFQFERDYVLNRKYRPLFTEEELKEARRRVKLLSQQ